MIANMKTLYEQGLTIQQIADRISKSYSYTYYKLRDAGIIERKCKLKPSHYVDIPKEELSRLYYDAYWSLEQIADYFYVSHPTILNRIKEYNMPKRTRRSSISIREEKQNVL